MQTTWKQKPLILLWAALLFVPLFTSLADYPETPTWTDKDIPTVVYTLKFNTGVHENAATCENIMVEVTGPRGSQSFTVPGEKLQEAATTTIPFKGRYVGSLETVRITIVNTDNCAVPLNDWQCDWIEIDYGRNSTGIIRVNGWFGDSYSDSEVSRTYKNDGWVLVPSSR